MSIDLFPISGKIVARLVGAPQEMSVFFLLYGEALCIVDVLQLITTDNLGVQHLTGAVANTSTIGLTVELDAISKIFVLAHILDVPSFNLY